jgi:hypothetical protein
MDQPQEAQSDWASNGASRPQDAAPQGTFRMIMASTNNVRAEETMRRVEAGRHHIKRLMKRYQPVT